MRPGTDDRGEHFLRPRDGRKGFFESWRDISSRDSGAFVWPWWRVACFLSGMRNFRRHHAVFAWHHSRVGLVTFASRVRRLFLQPVFLAVTLLGNLAVVCGASLLYWLEGDVNPGLDSLFDAFWWAVATVTTVGYGDVLPVTPAGRVLGIVMMLAGTALFCSYTALFAAAILSQEVMDVEAEIMLIEHRLRRLSESSDFDEGTLRKLADRVERVLKEFERDS